MVIDTEVWNMEHKQSNGRAMNQKRLGESWEIRAGASTCIYTLPISRSNSLPFDLIFAYLIQLAN